MSAPHAVDAALARYVRAAHARPQSSSPRPAREAKGRDCQTCQRRDACDFVFCEPVVNNQTGETARFVCCLDGSMVGVTALRDQQFIGASGDAAALWPRSDVAPARERRP
jgi:hypothetical protein